MSKHKLDKPEIERRQQDKELTAEQLADVSGGDVKAPRDSSTGQATGRRVVKP